MNAQMNRTVNGLWAGGASLLLSLAGSTVALAQNAASEVRVIAADPINRVDAQGESHTVEIRVEGKTVKVFRDGKELPQAQVSQDDGDLIITDKDGTQIQSIHLDVKGGDPFAWNQEGNARDYLFRAVESAQPLKTPKVMLGVHMGEPGPALCKHLGIEPNTATMISGVYEGLPADQAGITQYDIITQVDGKAPADSATVRNVLAKKEAGDTLSLTVIHEGKPKEVKVKLAAFDRNAMENAKLIGDDDQNELFSKLGKTWTGEGPMGELWSVQPRVFVAPGLPREQLNELLPRIEKFNALQRGAGDSQRGELNERLQQLDQRLAELEKMLQRLADRQERNR